MKKITSILLMLFCTVAVLAQVTTLAEVDQTKCYTVSTVSRGGWAVNNELTAFSSTWIELGTIASDVTDTKQQFAFVKDGNGRYYLWSVAAAKFVKSDCTFTDQQDAIEAVRFNKTGNAEYPIQVQFVGQNKYINLGGSRQMALDSWGYIDDGNSVKLTEAGDFDASAALAIIGDMPPADEKKFPEIGKYYQIHSAYTAFPETKAVYADGDIPAWNTLDESSGSFYWQAIATPEGIALKNAENGKYLVGNSERSSAWTLAEDSLGAEIELVVLATAVHEKGNEYGIYISGGMMHANRHGNGSGTNANIVTWSSEANSASAWYIVETELPAFCTVTYNFLYNDEVKFTQTVKVRAGAEYPDFTYELPYGATATKPAGVVENDVTVTLPIIVSVPFVAAASYAEITKWYYVKMHPQMPKYIKYLPAESYIGGADTAIDSSNEDSYKWAFVGDVFDGYKLVNYAAGPQLALHSEGSGYAYMSAYDNASSLIYSSSQLAGDAYFCLQHQNGNYINVQNGKVMHWANNDAGSTFMLVDYDSIKNIDVEIELLQDSFLYNGSKYYPEWKFVDESYKTLQEGVDYTVSYADNQYPGVGTITIKGLGNYSFTTTKEFVIEKGNLQLTLHYSYIVPSGEYVLGSAISSPSCNIIAYGAGNSSFSYKAQGDTIYTSEIPTTEGYYDIYLSISEGIFYKAIDKKYVGSYSIKALSATEWELVKTLCVELISMGWKTPWDISQGIDAVSGFQGLEFDGGTVVGLNLSKQGLNGLFPMTALSFPNINSINLSSNNLSGDVATALYDAVNKNPLLANKLTTLNISNNAYKGNVGLLAGCFPSLMALDASHNKFEMVYPAISEKVTNLNLASQNIDKVLNLMLNDAALADFASQIPLLMLYDHNQQTFKNTLSFTLTVAAPEEFNASLSSDWFITFDYSSDTSSMNITRISDDNSYRGESGDTINIILYEYSGVTNGSNMKIKFSFDDGDANFINGVDATDLQAIILYIFDNYSQYPFNFTAANVYKDDNINVQDIVRVVDIILNQPIATNTINKVAKYGTEESDAQIYIKDGKVILNTTVPVAAIDIKSSGSIEWNMHHLGMSQTVRGGNVVGYSLSGATLPMGESILGVCDDDAAIYSVTLSDEKATPIKYSLGYGGNTTSIENITLEDKYDIEIYNVAGAVQNSLSRGINVIKVNGKVKKVLKDK